jgi:hypothetical protein
MSHGTGGGGSLGLVRGQDLRLVGGLGVGGLLIAAAACHTKAQHQQQSDDPVFVHCDLLLLQQIPPLYTSATGFATTELTVKSRKLSIITDESEDEINVFVKVATNFFLILDKLTLS